MPRALVMERIVDLYEYLRRVEKRIADCVLRIAHYESLIRDLPQEDEPALRRAATLLGALRQAEKMHREYRARLLAKIYEQDAADARAPAPTTAAHDCPSLSGRTERWPF